ncbi:MAG: EscU/YscU/HrcU family type III secretion system export apparatus switch protein [Pseudomonadota bacterium]
MSDTEEKTHPASPRKLRKLRDEGQVANSSEASGFIGSALAVVAALALGSGLIVAFSEVVEIVAVAMTEPFDDALGATLADVSWRLFTILAPVTAAAIAASVLSAMVYNKGVPFSAKPLEPNFLRLSPVEGLKRIYGRRGLVETASACLRIVVWLVFLGIVAALWLPEFTTAVRCGFPCQAESAELRIWLVGLGLVVLLLLAAGADMLIQHFLFLHEQRMTPSEVKQERKESFGDAGIRAERRRRMREEPPDPASIGVDKANICLFSEDRAVAVLYHPQSARVPKVTAKLSDPAKIEAFKHRLSQSRLPVAESAHMVKVCWKVTPGHTMPPDHFMAFAKALRDALT